MENLNIDKFEPKKAELLAVAKEYTGLSIAGVEDKEGYETVRTARIDLKNKRVELSKIGKALRDDANKFSKAVIEKEKEYIAIIQPLEIEFQEKEDEYKKLLEIQERQEKMPERMEKLQGLGEFAETMILHMTDGAFDRFVFEKKQEKLEKEQAELEKEKQRIAEAKQKEEDEKKRVEDEKIAKEKEETRIKELEERAKKEAEENARKEIERKEQEKKNEIARIEKEKKEAIEKVEREAKEKETNRLLEEAKKIRLEKQKEEKQKLEDEKTRQNKLYTEKLIELGFDKNTDEIVQEGNHFIIKRIIGEFTI